MKKNFECFCHSCRLLDLIRCGIGRVSYRKQKTNNLGGFFYVVI